MSKERAVRRADREREAAIRAAARAAAAERRERKLARARRMKAKLPKLTPVGKHTGVLARRRRIQNFVLVDLLLVLNIVIWFVSGDWGVRVGALIVCLLFFPVLKTLMFPR